MSSFGLFVFSGEGTGAMVIMCVDRGDASVRTAHASTSFERRMLLHVSYNPILVPKNADKHHDGYA